MARTQGCQACKVRKIKCDEARPACLNCHRRDKICPGYRQEIAFRDMRRVAESKVETRVQKVLRTRESAELNAQIQRAIDEFFEDYVAHSDVVVLNTWFVKELYARPQSSNCFHEALKAAALRSKVNKHGGARLAAAADAAYSTALAILLTNLRDPVESLQDSTLGAAYILGLWEFISGSKDEPSSILTATTHHDGRISLLQERGPEQLSSPVGKCMFAFMVPMITLKCMVARQRPPKLAEEWLELARVKKPTVQVEKINFRTAEFCADAQILFDSAVQDDAWKSCLLYLIEVADDIDLEYRGWIDSYSRSDFWGYRTHPSPLGSGSSDYNVRTYRDLWVGAIWLGCLCKRAHLQQVLLHCLSLLEDLDPTEEGQRAMELSKATMQDMASSICTSVPFMLGIVNSEGSLIQQPKSKALGGYLLIYPLHIARWSVEEGSTMDSWIVSVQKAISKCMGIGSAEGVATRNRDVQWKLF